ncbi:DUF1801 domain-containing protein [Micromonospora sp. NPDC007271]|uniref:DUF1801 domain-containing protein n=1 Tax=Micromonospora sp. NPDC007271 TaxID=3154587 RepID=UPI0033CB1EAA
MDRLHHLPARLALIDREGIMKTTSINDYLTALGISLREIAETTRVVIDGTLADATGVMWHGHPVWGLGEAPGRRPICLIKAYTSYVTFGLWRGQEINDRSGRLTPSARKMASVRLLSTADIDVPLFTDWLRQARALEGK